MRHPNPNMLLRIAQGDAYCLATEYIKFPRDQEVYEKALRFESYGQHPTHKLAPGAYSDDTQMSIAVAEVLLKEGSGMYWPGMLQSRDCWADAFVECFKRDQRDGYARGFQAFLESVATGSEFLDRIKPDSDKNGAAMRSVPLGVMINVGEMLKAAECQARLTHDTEGGILSSQAVALMSYFTLHTDNPLTDLYDWCIGWLPEFKQFKETWSGPVQVPTVGLRTVHAVKTLLMQEKNLLDILRKTIEWGGDTDSVAAIAWGIASARMSGDDLPPFMEGGLENGKYGCKFLKTLGIQLMDTYDLFKRHDVHTK